MRGGLRATPTYLALLERAANLEYERGQVGSGESWFTQLLAALRARDMIPQGIEIARRLVEKGATEAELLQECAEHLGVPGENRPLRAAGQPALQILPHSAETEDALLELNRALQSSSRTTPNIILRWVDSMRACARWIKRRSPISWRNSFPEMIPIHLDASSSCVPGPAGRMNRRSVV